MTQYPKTVFSALAQGIRNYRAKQRKELIEFHVKKLCVLQGEVIQYLTLHTYYTEELAQIDPYMDHWGFAKMRQAQIALQKLSKAETKLNKLKESTKCSSTSPPLEAVSLPSSSISPALSSTS